MKKWETYDEADQQRNQPAQSFGCKLLNFLALATAISLLAIASYGWMLEWLAVPRAYGWSGLAVLSFAFCWSIYDWDDCQ